jgi:hypothetical protein
MVAMRVDARTRVVTALVLLGFAGAACGEGGTTGGGREPLGAELLGIGGSGALGTDTYLVEDVVTNYGGVDRLGIRGDRTGSSVMQVALVKWGVLPGGNSSGGSAGSGGSGPACNLNVTSATIRLYVLGTSNQSFNLYPANRDWVANEAHWTHFKSSNPWEVPGARGSLDRGAAFQSFTPSATGTLSIALNAAGLALVRSWLVNPASNHGIGIGHDTHSDGASIASFNSAIPSQRPQLIYDVTCNP